MGKKFVFYHQIVLKRLYNFIKNIVISERTYICFENNLQDGVKNFFMSL